MRRRGWAQALRANDHRSNLYLRPKLDHPVRRQVEIFHQTAGVARQRREQALAPQCHAFVTDAGDHGLAAEEERGLERSEFQLVLAALLERLHDVGPVLEAEV